jgi:hypothetical protein
MASRDQFTNIGGHDTDPILVDLDFLGDTDLHG